uniref:Slc24a-8 n=1 Tax=Schmidtea mediterranea TaxID=79327 RepID=A0A0H3YKA3_SCHMD|nr:slc24a-8 [Schmidtea mediterranea]
MLKKNHGAYFKILFFYFSLVIGMYFFTKFKSNSDTMSELHGTGRKLLGLKNCTTRSIEEFPNDFMTRKERKNGGIIFHIFVSIYLFVALAIICDEYFVSSLERLCEVFNIKHDVAGATFMAAGSSAPELCTSVIGVFITKSDVGISTIVGSAVFNVLCIIAICGIFVGSVIHLNWWPMFRDCIIYCLSIIALIIILNDGLIQWYEALIMLFMYVAYIIILYYNGNLYGFVIQRLPRLKGYGEEHNPLISQNLPTSFGLLDSSEEEEIMETGDVDSIHSRIRLDEDMTNLGESPTIFEVPNSFCHRLYWVAMLPVAAICYFTIPDCRKPGIWRKLFLVTFFISVIWISVATYILVWMICLIGDTLDIPDTIMGLTFLAAGTSIPDAIAGYLVAKDGYGDMAISNSIGSNVFDILICLGLPWFIRTSFLNPGSEIPVESSSLIFTTITLLSTVVVLVATIMVNKWKLNRFLGFIFLALYMLIIALSSLFELNILGNFNRPPCPRTSS